MIMTKVIKTAEDYNLALNRIEGLMDAKSGTAEFDELELLSTLVEIYEDKHYPINMPDPVSAIKFRMEQLGLSQQDLVPFIGSRSKVSEVLNKKRTLSLSMIKALSKGLGIPSDILLQGGDELSNIDYLQLEYEKFPFKEMIKKEWVSKTPDFETGSGEIIKELIRDAGGMESVERCLFRRSKSARENAKNDEYALTAWCLKVMSIAHKNPLSKRYAEGTVNEVFLREVVKLSYFENGPVLAKEYLEKHGIHLVTLEHLSRTYLDGAMIFPSNKNPVIGLTLRYDRVDNFWFCLLHELAHLSKHTTANGSCLIIDDLDLRKYNTPAEDSLERQADKIASESLVPGEVWSKLGVSVQNAPGPGQILELAQRLKVHPAIIAGKIRYETNNYRKYSNLLGHGGIRKHFVGN
jgi:HTH-type transcriptional regulator / antitoxin HigA